MNHSRRIFIIKIILPILGVGALFLALAKDWDLSAEISNEFVGEDRIFDESKLAAETPSIDIETEEGDRYKVAAESVNSLDGDTELFSGEAVDIEMQVGGNNVNLIAKEAEVEREKQTAIFRYNVIGEIDGETKFEGEELHADLVKREIFSLNAVKVTRSDAVVVADRFFLTGPEGARRIIFEGNVKGQLFMKTEQNE